MNGDGTTVYFWIDNKVEIVTSEEYMPIPPKFREVLCVDTRSNKEEYRYGMYSNMWVHVPFKVFPKEFQLILLTLGVT